MSRLLNSSVKNKRNKAAVADKFFSFFKVKDLSRNEVIWGKMFLKDVGARNQMNLIDGTNGFVIMVDTRQGPIVGDDGTYSGYTFKKYHDDKVYGTESNNNEHLWIEFRYAEIIMNYAEACLGLGEITEATTYINMIRNRAALPDFTGDITQALHYERRIEFVHEDVRWYDMRRWKILDQALQDATGVDIIQTTNRDNNTVTTTWQKIIVQPRGPAVDKLYWVPIPIDEINRAPQLQQNPGY